MVPTPSLPSRSAPLKIPLFWTSPPSRYKDVKQEDENTEKYSDKEVHVGKYLKESESSKRNPSDGFVGKYPSSGYAYFFLYRYRLSRILCSFISTYKIVKR